MKISNWLEERLPSTENSWGYFHPPNGDNFRAIFRSTSKYMGFKDCGYGVKSLTDLQMMSCKHAPASLRSIKSKYSNTLILHYYNIAVAGGLRWHACCFFLFERFQLP
jgi:hypothetical protein